MEVNAIKENDTDEPNSPPKKPVLDIHKDVEQQYGFDKLLEISNYRNEAKPPVQ